MMEKRICAELERLQRMRLKETLEESITVQVEEKQDKEIDEYVHSKRSRTTWQ